MSSEDQRESRKNRLRRDDEHERIPRSRKGDRVPKLTPYDRGSRHNNRQNLKGYSDDDE